MKKISKILFPTDFSNTSNNAFRYAIWFADKYGASIELLHAIYPETEPTDIPIMVASTTQNKIEATKEIMKVFVNTTLAQTQAAHELKNVPLINSEIQVGIPSMVISDVSNQNDIDLIIMGTKDKHSAFERAFGSVTTATLAKASCPVLVIPEYVEFEQINTVAYATDLTEADPYHIWEAGKLLEPFCPILRVVHIEQNPKENKPLKLKDMETFFKGNAPSLQITFHDIASKAIVPELEDFSETWDIDLLIMHKPQRGLFERIFHGSISNKMALYSKIPLLIFK
ncbi:MAG: universal stress protein [Bacteroidetes bacterium]|jgi:nucleotide-binding universal stress UspA family protein|nr:universal stress protein [Bacteroidota bacterium]